MDIHPTLPHRRKVSRTTWAVYAASVFAAIVAPRSGRAEVILPLPFLGPTQTYTVSGCGPGLLEPDYTRGTAVCVSGSATVGSVVPSSGFALYQILVDLAYEPTPRFTTPFALEDAFVISTHTSARDGQVVTRPTELGTGGTPQKGDRTVTLFSGIDIPAVDIVPNTVALIGGYAHFSYRDPREPVERNTVTVPLAFSAIPEPTTLALVAGGLALAAGGALRRRHA